MKENKINPLFIKTNKDKHDTGIKENASCSTWSQHQSSKIATDNTGLISPSNSDIMTVCEDHVNNKDDLYDIQTYRQRGSDELTIGSGQMLDLHSKTSPTTEKSIDESQSSDTIMISNTHSHSSIDAVAGDGQAKKDSPIIKKVFLFKGGNLERIPSGTEHFNKMSIKLSKNSINSMRYKQLVEHDPIVNALYELRDSRGNEVFSTLTEMGNKLIGFYFSDSQGATPALIVVNGSDYHQVTCTGLEDIEKMPEACIVTWKSHREKDGWFKRVFG
ncbi:hypothetical protein AX774_g868 [Zancudomyces culisetae]|uniref:Uncharacterized protein n=1 Tax=Zancudomyces culisetae TaxID=1213189 RepID=A0A1R1PQF1_ZANCU|nr:hypothetical protein AX774_g3291 [Zancudomyces culisetae]OMH85580.1 hypothetical protein AX774_g868 [Zancudomyces culisetae]|eukprot:OMH83216.1 hypothetical protein AX774_g3291 [Zancudomyces culisetae]